MTSPEARTEALLEECTRQEGTFLYRKERAALGGRITAAIRAAEEAEREACAKLVEANAPPKPEFPDEFYKAIIELMLGSVRAVQKALATAIRARSKP